MGPTRAENAAGKTPVAFFRAAPKDERPFSLSDDENGAPGPRFVFSGGL
jgi:hypothetical protein